MSSPPLTNQSAASEGSGGAAPPTDERKRKRMLSNRESARRSRMKKQQRLDELITLGAQLREDNARIAAQADALEAKYSRLEPENAFMRAQVVELTERLQSLNSVLRFVEEFSGIAMDIPDVPEPWQLPCATVQPIMASADMFQF